MFKFGEISSEVQRIFSGKIKIVAPESIITEYKDKLRQALEEA